MAILNIGTISNIIPNFGFMNSSLQEMTVSIRFTKAGTRRTTSVYTKGKIMYTTYIINNLPTIEWTLMMSSVVLCS